MKQKLREIFCAIFRHSNIESSCFGYVSCTRCNAQRGDTLAGAYHNALGTDVECGCLTCQDNYSKATFLDKFLASEPKWIGTPPGEYRAKKRQEVRDFLASVRQRKEDCEKL